MNSPRALMVLAAMLLMVSSIPDGAAQTVKQGAGSPAEQTSFNSPMVLETEFAAANRSLWEPSQGHEPGAWFSTEEYHALGRFSCDGVYLRKDFNGKHGTWKSGLEMAVLPAEGGNLTVKVRAAADNPDDNHDRKVDILIEVVNGDKVIATASPSKVIEEGNSKYFTTNFSLPAALLRSAPATKLRMTVKTAWD